MKTGKLPENVLKRSVLRQTGTRGKEVLSGAGIGKDCATLAFTEERNIVVCAQEGAVSLERWDGADEAAPEPYMTMGDLLQKCANNLAAGGARPFGCLLTLLLPENTDEADVRALMKEAEEKCGELSMTIAGGQTRITRGALLPMAAVTGFGKAWTDTPCGMGMAAPGQDIVISKWIGLQGTALLARRNRERLLERYPAYLVEEAEGFGRWLSVLPEAEIGARFGARAMHDASEGGIFGALWELAESSGTGLMVDMRKLPLRQETVEVCECCNANPYELLAGGCLVMAAEDGPGLAAALEKEHIPAVVVGKITEGNDRILINGDEIRYMDRPQRDEIFRSC